MTWWLCLYFRVICTPFVHLYLLLPLFFKNILPKVLLCKKWGCLLCLFVFCIKKCKCLCKCILYWLSITWTGILPSFFYRFSLDLHAASELKWLLEQSLHVHTFTTLAFISFCSAFLGSGIWIHLNELVCLHPILFQALLAFRYLPTSIPYWFLAQTLRSINMSIARNYSITSILSLTLLLWSGWRNYL